MNSQEFRNAARTTFALATEEVVEVVATEEVAEVAKFNIDQAIIEWKAEKIAEKFYAKWRAGEATDADTAEYHNRYNIARVEATAKGCEEVVEATAKGCEEVVEATTLNTSEAFGIAWGADGEVLTYEQTDEAIKTGKGWFDTQGRWTNKAGFEKQVAAELEAYRVARLASK